MPKKTLLALSALLSFSNAASAAEIVIEAESAQSIASPMKVYSKDSASGGKYIATNTSNSGSATYNISVSSSGQYVLSARVKTPTETKNSIFVTIDGGAKLTWHLPVLSSYGWATFSTALSLSAGNHQLRIQGREAYTEVDVLKLTSSGSNTVPTPSPTPSPSPTPNPTPSPTPIATPTPVPGTLDPSLAPARNFDLSLWKITLPIDSSGGFSGTASEVKPIPSQYEREPYFYTAADGAMVFMAPVEGATTSGSKYPRSELREMNKDVTNAAWTVEQGGTLSATLAVRELPTTSSGTKGRVVIGQIHGPNDELCRLYYDNGKLYFYDDKSGSSHQELQYVLKNSSGVATNIPMNDKFDYTIKVSKGYMTVSATHNGVQYSATEQISSFWPGLSLYFKAGIYVQVGKAGSGAGTTGSGRGRVDFYRLAPPSHP